MRLYREHLRNDDVSRLAMEGLALEVLAECARCHGGGPERNAPPWLRLVRKLLHDRFAENLTHEAIAAEVGIHPVHLARAIRRHCGSTLGDYVRKLRVDFAAHKLVTTDEPLTGIALAAGFSGQSHFSRTFKRQTGMTTSTFRISSRLR